MKASDFILNSDYLSIAQVDKTNYTFTVPGGTIGPDDYMSQNYDFSTTAQNNTIDNVLIRKDADSFIHGDYMWIQPTKTANGVISGFVRVYRPSATTIRAQIMLENLSYIYPGVSLSYPGMAFTVRVSSFKVPNAF